MISWDMVSSLAAVVGVAVAAGTFWKSYSRMKQSDQIRIVHDIMNNKEAKENAIIETINAEKYEDVILRYTQYLNVWEWYSFLVNKNQITLPEVIEFYKDIMLKERKGIFEAYPELDDENKFKEYRALCKKLESENS